MRKRTAEEKPAAIKAVLSSAGAVFGRSAPGAARVIPALWRGRGFSDRVVQALTDYGIDAPERLLFMTEAQLRKIPGILKASRREILDYRERFLFLPL